jgi:hypothetical protein
VHIDNAPGISHPNFQPQHTPPPPPPDHLLVLQKLKENDKKIQKNFEISIYYVFFEF